LNTCFKLISLSATDSSALDSDDYVKLIFFYYAEIIILNRYLFNPDLLNQNLLNQNLLNQNLLNQNLLT